MRASDACGPIKHGSPKLGARTIHDGSFAKTSGRKRKNDARAEPHFLGGLESNQIGSTSGGANQSDRMAATQLVGNLHPDPVDLIKGKPRCQCWFGVNPPAAESDDCATMLNHFGFLPIPKTNGKIWRVDCDIRHTCDRKPQSQF